MALATKARTAVKDRVIIPDTKRCPKCGDWFLQDDATSRLLSSYDTHILTTHPELPQEQNQFLREFYKVPDSVSLQEFFREPEEEERKRKAMAEKTAKKEQAEKAPKAEAGPCLDGCGMMANPGRNFLPGHDAKLKSYLLKVDNGDPSVGDVPASVKDKLKDLFNGKFAHMAAANYRKPAVQATSSKKSDKAEAVGKLAQLGKGAGAAARKAAAS